MENKIAELKKIKEALEVLINESEKPKLVSGWYVDKSQKGWIANFDFDTNKVYGIDTNGNWFKNYIDELDINDFKKGVNIPATHSEVQEALTKEAVKRGFKEGVKCKGIKYTTKQIIHDNINFDYWFNDNILWVDAADETRSIVIFRNGTWATVLPNKKQMTISQIESELGYEIEIINK